MFIPKEPVLQAYFSYKGMVVISFLEGLWKFVSVTSEVAAVAEQVTCEDYNLR